MSSTSETGHAKNVANFENLISFCTGYGTDYNPSKDNIKLPALNDLLVNAQAALLTVKTTKTTFDKATNLREISFEPFKKLCTRIINALEATDAASQTIDDAKTINRKIQGKRADKIIPSPPPADPNAKTTEEHHISVSQQSFDNMIDHFTKMIQLVSAEPLYNPNESDLKVDQLNSFLADLKAANTSALTIATEYSNARIARNTILYAPKTGLIDVAKGVKKYVKSVFGTTSPKYKQISGLKLTKNLKE